MNIKFFRFFVWMFCTSVKCIEKNPVALLPISAVLLVTSAAVWGHKGLLGFFAFAFGVALYQLFKKLWRAFCKHEEALRQRAESRMTK